MRGTIARRACPRPSACQGPRPFESFGCVFFFIMQGLVTVGFFVVVGSCVMFIPCILMKVKGIKIVPLWSVGYEVVMSVKMGTMV